MFFLFIILAFVRFASHLFCWLSFLCWTKANFLLTWMSIQLCARAILWTGSSRTPTLPKTSVNCSSLLFSPRCYQPRHSHSRHLHCYSSPKLWANSLSPRDLSSFQWFLNTFCLTSKTFPDVFSCTSSAPPCTPSLKTASRRRWSPALVEWRQASGAWSRLSCRWTFQYPHLEPKIAVA